MQDFRFWKRDGPAWEFHSAIGFGHGRISNWKGACKNGRAPTERMRFVSSQLNESRFLGQQRFPGSRRAVSKRLRTCQGGSVHKCECAGVRDSRRTECWRFAGVATAFCSDLSSATARMGLLKPARPRDAQRRCGHSVGARFMEILLRRFSMLA